jgi:hypothetical protein
MSLQMSSTMDVSLVLISSAGVLSIPGDLPFFSAIMVSYHFLVSWRLHILLSVLQYMLFTFLMVFILFKSCPECSFHPPKMSLGLPIIFLCYPVSFLFWEHCLSQQIIIPWNISFCSREYFLIRLPCTYILFSLKIPSISSSLYSVLPSLYAQPVTRSFCFAV